MSKINKTNDSRYWWGLRKRWMDTCLLLVQEQTWTVIVKISEKFPQSAESRPITISSFQLMWISPKDSTSNYRDTCSHLFIDGSSIFTATGNWKQIRCSPTGEWIVKIWYVYMIEYYSTISLHLDHFIFVKLLFTYDSPRGIVKMQ